MKNFVISGLSVLAFTLTHAQKSINKPLKKELDSLYYKDQVFREYFSTKLDSAKIDSISRVYNIPKDNFSGGLAALMDRTDSLNMIRLEEIIAQYGYPGKKLVGENTNEAAFFIIQHSKKIDQYLPLVKKAVDEGELSFVLYAMMKDRSLMYNNQPQIWGTQAKGMTMTNSTTGKPEWKFFIWPIEDPANVNERRKKAGFPQTVEENAKRMGLEYRVITMEQVKAGKID